jgi:Polyketide cyclase / dehydrase and lipid transport
MATLRETIHIDASPDKIWAEVRDPLSVLNFFDALETAEMVGSARKIKMGDIFITEEIVTVDDDLRRFQYSITEMPIPVEFHLSTIDVLEDGDGTLIVYGVDVRPDMLKDILAPTISGATAAMKAYFEK